VRLEAAGRATGISVRVMSEDPFVDHRSLLFTVAYEMLGSVADAEDMVQETWLRWAPLVDAERCEIRDPRAYLVRIVARLCHNRLRTLVRQREEYVGEWLPVPLRTSPDVAEDIELAESVSIAMLAVLETLLPTERAVFVLREVFDVPYDEIAAALDKSPVAVRQIATRARKHVAARRPRMAVSRTEQEQVVHRFLAALTTGDVAGLLEVLAPEVLVVGDGGGLAPTIPKPVRGAARLAPVMARFAVAAPGATAFIIDLNGGIGARIDPGGQNDTAVSLVIEDGRITRIYAIRNPHKLERLGDVVELRR
jgi:RNA polymerase sigma factor (sigma-70 family)